MTDILSTIKTADELFSYIQSDASFTEEIAIRLLAQLPKEEKVKFDAMVQKAKEANAKKHSQAGTRPEMIEKVTKATVILASEIWARVQQEYKDGTMQNLSDDEKMAKIRDARPEYKSFVETHPVVCRYMICTQNFESVPFRRYVVRRLTYQYLPKDQQSENYVKEQYARRQAEYVSYLYEYKNRLARPSPKKLTQILEETYKLLLGEIDDFSKIREEADATTTTIISERRHANAEFVVQKVAQTDNAETKEALRKILLEKVREKRAKIAEEKRLAELKKLAEEEAARNADAADEANEAKIRDIEQAASDPQTDLDITEIIDSMDPVSIRPDVTPSESSSDTSPSKSVTDEHH